jgi:porin
MTGKILLSAIAGAAVATWATHACAGDDWAAPIVTVQQSLASLGISLGGGVTGFAQGLAAGDGLYGVPIGGKADVLLGLDGQKLGLWPGLSVSAHFEQDFGRDANTQGDGSILPVNTALGFPTLGGTTTDLSLIVSQTFANVVTITLGKFNMLDVASNTPLIGGGGETTFWNLGIAAPVSAVTPPYIVGGIGSLKLAPVTFTLMVYDPRNAQDLDVLAHPFDHGTTTSVSATMPITVFGLTGYHTLRGVYSTASGFDFDQAPQLLLPPASREVLTRQGYTYGAYTLQQFLWADPDNPGKGWGFFTQLSASDANPNPIGNVVLVGLGGSTPGRADDRWGIAWCDYLFSRDLKNGLAVPGEGINDERVLEAYYDTALAPHLRLGPDAQIIWPGTPGKTTALFLGLRGRVVF